MTPYGYQWRILTRPRALERAGGRVDPIWRGAQLVRLVYRGGARCEKCGLRDWEFVKAPVRSRLDVAHLDGNHRNDLDDNLAALCHPCHHAHDYPDWARRCHETRCARKDPARPLLAVLEQESPAEPLSVPFASEAGRQIGQPLKDLVLPISKGESPDV